MERCRACLAMERSETPSPAADGPGPAGREWLVRLAGSVSVRTTARLIARVAPSVESRSDDRFP